MPRKKQISKTIKTVDEPVEIVPVQEVEPPVNEKKKRAPNAWVKHCQQVHAKHKDMPYKEVLKTAKETYNLPKKGSTKVSCSKEI